MKSLPHEAETLKGTQKNRGQGRLILFLDLKKRLRCLQGFVPRRISYFCKDKTRDSGIFKIELQVHEPDVGRSIQFWNFNRLSTPLFFSFAKILSSQQNNFPFQSPESFDEPKHSNPPLQKEKRAFSLQTSLRGVLFIRNVPSATKLRPPINAQAKRPSGNCSGLLYPDFRSRRVNDELLVPTPFGKNECSKCSCHLHQGLSNGPIRHKGITSPLPLSPLIC